MTGSDLILHVFLALKFVSYYHLFDKSIILLKQWLIKGHGCDNNKIELFIDLFTVV